MKCRRKRIPGVRHPDRMAAEKNSGCETSGWNDGGEEFPYVINSNWTNRIPMRVMELVHVKIKIVKCKYLGIYKVQNRYSSTNSKLSNKFHKLKWIQINKYNPTKYLTCYKP